MCTILFPLKKTTTAMAGTDIFHSTVNKCAAAIMVNGAIFIMTTLDNASRAKVDPVSCNTIAAMSIKCLPFPLGKRSKSYTSETTVCKMLGIPTCFMLMYERVSG